MNNSIIRKQVNKSTNYRDHTTNRIKTSGELSFEQIMNAQIIQGSYAIIVKNKDNTKDCIDRLSNNNKLKVTALNFKKNA